MLLKAMEEQTDEQVEVVPESQGARKKIFMTSVMMKAAHKLIVLKQRHMAI